MVCWITLWLWYSGSGRASTAKCLTCVGRWVMRGRPPPWRRGEKIYSAFSPGSVYTQTHSSSKCWPLTSCWRFTGKITLTRLRDDEAFMSRLMCCQSFIFINGFTKCQECFHVSNCQVNYIYAYTKPVAIIIIMLCFIVYIIYIYIYIYVYVYVCV